MLYIHDKLHIQYEIVKEFMIMDFLSDTLLLEAYKKAVELQLNEDFISLIKEELVKRALD